MTLRSVKKIKSHQNRKLLTKSSQSAKFNDSFKWREVRDFNKGKISGLSFFPAIYIAI